MTRYVLLATAWHRVVKPALLISFIITAGTLLHRMVGEPIVLVVILSAMVMWGGVWILFRQHEDEVLPPKAVKAAVCGTFFWAWLAAFCYGIFGHRPFLWGGCLAVLAIILTGKAVYELISWWWNSIW